MPDDVPSVSQVGGLIPNVWFDIFGRIIPGVFLILGEFDATWDTPFIVWLKCYLKGSAIGPAIGLLLLVVAAHIVGSALGHLSFWIVDCGIVRHWRVKIGDVNSRVREIIRKQYGDDWDGSLRNDHEVVLKARDFCSYYIWNRSPSLAVLFGRWDAEALCSRSIFVVSVILLTTYCYLHGWRWIMFILIALAAVSLPSFAYHQRRAIRSRFDMLLILAPADESNGQQQATAK